jgi:hypothetical protein
MVFAVITDRITEDDVSQMYDAYRVIHERGERFFLLQDARAAKLPDALTRKKLSELNTHFEADIERHVVGIAVVVPNRVYAGAVQALYWMSKEYAPTKAFASAGDALEHARGVLPEDAPPFPPATADAMKRLDELWQEKKMADFTLPPS